jgi:hypothetical protein
MQGKFTLGCAQIEKQMKTLNDIKRAVAKVGGTVEEDEGYRDMRVLQLIAPAGKLWAGTDCQCEPVHWACGSAPHAVKYNEKTFADILDTLSHGAREMTPEEAEEHAED